MKLRSHLEFLSKMFSTFHHPTENFSYVTKLILMREETNNQY
jgi:hypothetical protein